MELTIERIDCGAARVLAARGEIDTQRASRQLEDALQECVNQGLGSLLLDGSDLDHISSAGLRVLLMVGKRLEAEGGRLALCRLNPEVREVLAVAGMARDFKILATRAEGLRYLAEEARLARLAHLATTLLREREAAQGGSPKRHLAADGGGGRRMELAAEIIGAGKSRPGAGSPG